MKKALSFLLAALLLTGCAAQPAPESAASPPPDSVAVESPSSPLATPSGEGARRFPRWWRPRCPLGWWCRRK